MLQKFLKILVIVSFALCPAGAEAKGLDSTRQIIIPNSLEVRMYDAKLTSPVGVYLLPRSSFGHASLEYGYQSGKMMRIQMPEKANEIRVRSIGLHSANTWQLYGEFAYTRQYNDSVQWLLSEMPQDGLPYYFGSPKKGNWEIEAYNIKGTFDWNISQLFVVGASAHIKYRKGARSNDPRPSTESFTSRYYLFGGITLPRFSVLLSGGLGYGTRDNNIVYNNTDNDRVARLDIMAYELMGFGMNRKTQQYQNRTLETNIYTRHTGLQLKGNIDSLTLWARFSYDVQRDSIRRSRTTNVSRSLLSTYKTTKISLDFGVDYAFSSTVKLQTQAYAYLTKGSDKLDNILQGQKNYVYNHRLLGFNALLCQDTAPGCINRYGLSAGYEYEKRQDGPSAHLFERSGLDASLTWHRQHALRSACYIFYGAGQWLLFPTATLTYPASQENIFSTDVARPLYNYYHTAKGATELNIGGGKAFYRYRLSLSLTYNLAYALANTYEISGMRHNLNAAIILSF